MRIPIGPDEANREVIVTVQPAGRCNSEASGLDWGEFVARTYGSCEGLDIERPPQGEYEARESVE